MRRCVFGRRKGTSETCGASTGRTWAWSRWILPTVHEVWWPPEGFLRPLRELRVVCESQLKSSVFLSSTGDHWWKAKMLRTWNCRWLSGGKAHISIIYYHLDLQTESLTTCFDSKPNPVWFGEYSCTFIHKLMSQMIRFHQGQKLYKFLHKDDLYASATIYQLRSFIIDMP